MEEVSWAMFADKLKWRFRDFTKSVRELSDAELAYLGEKLLGSAFKLGATENLTITRARVFQVRM